MKNNTDLPISILTKSQTKEFKKEFKEDGKSYTIKVVVRFDDQCQNGHNTFSITGEITNSNGRWESGGMLHDEIEKHFPELAKFLKWHLTSSDGPLYYIANTVYHAECGKFDYARSSAVWLEASDNIFMPIPIQKRHPEAHPMLEFKAAVEELGFVY